MSGPADTGRRCPRCDCPDDQPQCEHCKVCPHGRPEQPVSGPCARPECGGEIHTDGWGTPIRCPRAPEPDSPAADQDEGRPEPPDEAELNAALPVRPDPRQPAYDAVYEYIRALGTYLPPDPVHRNAIIWRAVHAALNATPIGRCVSSHCVEGDHMVFNEEGWEAP